MISEPKRRISSCRRPTAFVPQSSERNEFEHTSSASPAVLCAAVDWLGRIVQRDGDGVIRKLPSRLRPCEAAADNMDRLHRRRPLPQKSLKATSSLFGAGQKRKAPASGGRF